jgi:hypothetical protein
VVVIEGVKNMQIGDYGLIVRQGEFKRFLSISRIKKIKEDGETLMENGMCFDPWHNERNGSGRTVFFEKDAVRELERNISVVYSSYMELKAKYEKEIDESREFLNLFTEAEAVNANP